MATKKATPATIDPTRPYAYDPAFEALLDRLEVPHREYADWAEANSVYSMGVKARHWSQACAYAALRYRAADQAAAAMQQAGSAPVQLLADDAGLDALCAALDIPRQEYADHEEARGLYAMSRARRLSFACAYAAQRYQAAEQAADLIEHERWLGVYPGPRREERRERKAAMMKRVADQAVKAIERARRV